MISNARARRSRQQITKIQLSNIARGFNHGYTMRAKQILRSRG